MFTAFRTAFKAATKNPFRSYFKVGSVGFGATFVSNILWTSVDKEAPLSMTKNPETYTACLFAKSAYAGFLWPAIPFRIYNNPRKFFCVGGGLQRTYQTMFDGVHNFTLQELDKFQETMDIYGPEARKYIVDGLLLLKYNL